jgi:hypothetical protein
VENYKLNDSPIYPGVGTDKFIIGTVINFNLLDYPNSKIDQSNWNIRITENLWLNVDKETSILTDILFQRGYAGRIDHKIGIGSPAWMLTPVDKDGYCLSAKYTGLSFGVQRVEGIDVVSWIQVFSPNRITDLDGH